MDNDDRQIGRILSRREVLALLGTAGATLLVGCGATPSGAAATSAPAAALASPGATAAANPSVIEPGPHPQSSKCILGRK